MKILANDGIAPIGKQKLEAAGFTVVTDKVDQAQLADAINKEGYEVLLVRSATTARKDLIDACPNLKYIGRGGVGMDNIDVEYARSVGRTVFNTPGASSQSVAELVFAHLFNMVRFLYDSNRQMPVKGETEFNTLKKKYGKGSELRGKTIGIIGFGRIGQATAQYALGCGMKVVASDPGISSATITVEVGGVEKVTVEIQTIPMEELLKQADFISLHVPKIGDKALIGKEELAKMKDGVVLVNSARGGMIDELALVEALNSGKVAHAGIDVFQNEPTPKKELLSHPKISLTPHIGAATEEAQDRIGEELADFLIASYKQQTVS
ncbi:MAG: NAD(P)-binding domain-containing protein [Flavobacteriales bacterium]|nr:NAD(P)-binding domain-containing protein [Flavobacteriales bacterium]MCB9447848.1 NAD(P)-binding domain-containing protein [Flavobacteriales bacterium]